VWHKGRWAVPSVVVSVGYTVLVGPAGVRYATVVVGGRPPHQGLGRGSGSATDCTLLIRGGRLQPGANMSGMGKLPAG